MTCGKPNEAGKLSTARNTPQRRAIRLWVRTVPFEEAQRPVRGKSLELMQLERRSARSGKDGSDHADAVCFP
jgi:hypothetical protein